MKHITPAVQSTGKPPALPESPASAGARKCEWTTVDLELMHASLADVVEPALVLGLDGEVLAWNLSLRQLLCRDAADPVPRSIFDIAPEPEHPRWRGWFQTLMAGEHLPSVHGSLRCADGGLREIDGALLAVAVAEDRMVVRAHLHDRSRESRAEAARRESEDRFRTLCATAPVGVFQTDPDGRLTYTNDRWRRLGGLHHVSEPRGVWWQVVHPDDRPRVLGLWESCRRHGHEFLAEFRLLVGQSQSRWSRTRIAQRSGLDGRLQMFIGTTEDITDLKRIEMELAAARDAAMESARLKANFLGNVSHEVRTPMNGVLGMLELLGETPLDARQRRYTEIARESASVLLRLLEDILDFSRLDAGRLRLEALPFSPEALLRDTCELFQAKADSKGIRLGYAMDARLPGTVVGDSVRLRQVLGNLVGNALKFTDRGSVAISCQMVSVDARRCVVRIEVADTGIGIPTEARPRLFQPFYQVDGGLTRQHGGTGLGLAIVRQLVELMGGEMRLESTVGEGSRFWFDVPFALETGSPTDPAPGR